MEKQLVIFELAHEHYGVDIATVDSIIKMQATTAVPFASQFVEGVINLRGVVLPVLDLRKRFGFPPTETSQNTRIVVVEVDGLTIGMIVDAVTEVMSVPDEAIEPPSPMMLTADSAFITGIAKVGERLIILLDLHKILSSQEQVELQPLHKELSR